MCCDISFTFDWLIIILYKLYWKFSFKTLIKINYNLYFFLNLLSNQNQNHKCYNNTKHKLSNRYY